MIRIPVRQRQTLRQLHLACQASGLPWVSYRLPGESEPITHIHLDTTTATFDAHCQDGFVIAPFDFPAKAAFWLRNDLSLKGFQPDLHQAQIGALGTQQIIQLSRLHEKYGQELEPANPQSADKISAVTQATYENLVQQALASIDKGIFQKVVLSRFTDISLPEGIRPDMLFESLCQLYPTAFVSLYELPGLGCWIGASPELLLSRRGEHFESMSLAGTLSPHKNEHLWQPKEQHEQQIVTSYITEQLRNCGLTVEVGEQETIQAGQVFHLRNTITATGQAGVFKVVNKLHPTPAVCGFPVEAARQFITEKESHHRQFYSGFLGPIAADGNAAIYVNLRAARLENKNARLFLGGGIVQGSNPAAEWQETEAKAATLLAAIAHAGVSA